MSILRLQKEVSAAKIANDRLQTMWLESQKENLKTKEVIQTLTAESTFLKTQLGITDVIKSKTLQQTGEAKKEGIESKFEAAKLYSELKKLQPIIDELREKNVSNLQTLLSWGILLCLYLKHFLRLFWNVN